MTRRRRAQAALEFALCLPVLLMLLLGVFDAGRGVVAAISIDNATRDATRFAAVHLRDGTCASPNCQTEAQMLVVNTALGIDSSLLHTTVTVGSGNVVNLVTTYPITAVSPIVGSALGSVTLTATSSMLSR